ncbi:MAG: phenylalanine--tRNA ligase subunit beta, partial [Candidatus Omnitrophica bacterium]|nr:phenylalanine--tRNA ligase subunit beta [Candidatus Omnitrophota bacterium]
MRFSIKDLQRYLEGSCSIDDVEYWLSMLGLNPQIFKESDDVFLEIEAPANRGDLLSAIGIIRAIAPFGRVELRYPDRSIKEESTKLMYVEIESFLDCPFYAGRIIEDVIVEPSPGWLVDRVTAAGFRSVNNVVDITNLVLWELGHPLHAFDLDMLEGKIIVRRARVGEQIVTIDGNKRELSPDVLVIADAEKPVAIAGIMGGSNTEVTYKTKNLFVESAFFEPSRVRKASKLLSLSTDASTRFEKKADPSLIIPALDRCCKLIHDVCGGRVSVLTSAGKNLSVKKNLLVNLQRVESYLGCKIPIDFAVGVLKKIDFQVNVESDALVVGISEGRPDLETDVDIIEEIAKYWGYDKIPEEMPVASIAFTPSSHEFMRTDALKDLLTKMGFTEVINTGLLDENELYFSYGLSAIEIINPLSKNYSYLRNSLIPGILNNIRDNHNRKIESVSIFEIGNVYYKNELEFIEKPVLCLGVMNKYDYYSFKGRVQAILKKIDYSELVEKVNILNEGTMIEFSGTHGCIARIVLPSRDFLKRYDIEHQSVFLCEIMLEKFIEAGFSQITYTPLPKFLSITRDLSLVVPDTANWKDVETFIRSIANFIESVEVFDIYRGKNVPAGSTGVSISIVFSNNEGKLSREDVDQLMKEIINGLEKKFSISVRK